MPRTRKRQSQSQHSIGLTPVFVCPVDSCPGKTRVLTGGNRAWTRHRRAYHPNVDFSQYEDVMRTNIPASDALNPSEMSSPSISLASIPEDDPFTMEDYYTDSGLPPDDLLLPAEQSQLESDTDSDSQSDRSVKTLYHPMLDGMPSFFIYVQPLAC